MSTLIVAAILIAIIVIISMLLVSIANHQKKKKMNQLLKHFSRLGTSNNMSFSSHEITGHRIIGLDGINKKLLILTDNNHSGSENFIIDLEEVKNCTVKKYYGNIGAGALVNAKLETYLEKITLHFQFNNDKEPVDVSFYDHFHDEIYQVKYLEHKADHWKQILTKMLKVPFVK